MMLLLVISLYTIQDFSTKLNKSLPEVYDSITKLERTSVEGDFLVYHFTVDLSQSMFTEHVGKMKNRAEQSSCKNKNTHYVLTKLNKPILYKYENLKGQSLGQFQLAARRCL